MIDIYTEAFTFFFVAKFLALFDFYSLSVYFIPHFVPSLLTRARTAF